MELFHLQAKITPVTNPIPRSSGLDTRVLRRHGSIARGHQGLNLSSRGAKLDSSPLLGRKWVVLVLICLGDKSC